MDDLNILLLKFLSRKSFYIKNFFPNNSYDSRIDEILYSKATSGRVVIDGVEQLFTVKKGSDFNIYRQTLKWKSVCQGGGGYQQTNSVKKFKSYLPMVPSFSALPKYTSHVVNLNYQGLPSQICYHILCLTLSKTIILET